MRPDWDTRGSGAPRTGSDYRLAIAVAALLTVAILAAVTSKVLASNPPILPDSSPTADHVERPAPDRPTEPPDPRGLFLDLPDPPKPQTPEASGVNLDNRNSGDRNIDGLNSEDRDPKGRSPEDRGPEDRGPADGVSESAASSKRSSGGSGSPRGFESGASDIPVVPGGAAERTPPVQPVKPGSGNVEDLLNDPDCRFSTYALMDLKAGVVDEYLVSALQAVCREHSIYVNVFKTGHTFGQGLAEGPTIPAGYGNAGGYPNTHYFGRGADIWEVDGKPVEGNGADPDVVDVGRMLAGLPTRNKPDVVIGPAAWNQALGYGPNQGWVLDQDQVVLHDDHLHIGYWHGDGTPPPQLFGSPDDLYKVSSPENSGVLQAPAISSYDSDSDRDARATPKLKETIEPAKSPAPKPRPAKDAGKKKPAPQKPAPQKPVERQTQTPEPKKEADPQEPVRKKDAPEASREKRPESDARPPGNKSAPPNKKQTTHTKKASSRATSVQYESHVEGIPPAGGTVVEDATAED